MLKRNNILNIIFSLMLFLEPTTCTSVPRISEECEAMGICENVPNYPYDYVVRMLANKTDGLLILSSAESDDEGNEKKYAEEENYDYDDFCPSYKKRVKPKAARDQNGAWHFIVNGIAGYPNITLEPVLCRQDVLKQTCGRCTEIKAEPYSGYRAICEQEKSLYLLPGLDEHGKPFVLKFNSPACCTCVVYKDIMF